MSTSYDEIHRGIVCPSLWIAWEEKCSKNSKGNKGEKGGNREEKGGSKYLSLTIVQSFYSEFRHIYPQVVYLFLKHQYLCIWIRGKISGSSYRPKNNTTKFDLGYQQPSGTCLRWRSARWSRCARSTDMGSAACSSPRRTTSCPDTSTWNLTSR